MTITALSLLGLVMRNRRRTRIKPLKLNRAKHPCNFC